MFICVSVEPKTTKDIRIVVKNNKSIFQKMETEFYFPTILALIALLEAEFGQRFLARTAKTSRFVVIPFKPSFL